MKKILLFIITLTFTNAKAQTPALQWAKSAFGGTSNGYALAVDALGNVYTTGNFLGTVDFDPNAGIFNLSASGKDVFICKLDPAGNFVWAKSMVGGGNNGAFSIALDAAGNIYTVGSFHDTVDFDPNAGTYNLFAGNTPDAFISKLDPAGNFVWAKNIGAIGSNVGAVSVSVDAMGNIYTAGAFYGTVDFDPNAGVSNLTAVGNSDLFISKLDSAGNFVWAKSMGGSPNSIGISTHGDIYITGTFQGTADMDPGAAIFNLTAQSGNDVFICKLDTSGNFVWAKSLMGSGGNDESNSLTIDTSGNVYTTGYFSLTVDFDPNAGVHNLTAANGDLFICKLDASGSFVWAKQIAGTTGECITLDKLGNVYTTGQFGTGTVDFDPNGGVFNLSTAGTTEIFIDKLDSSGNFVWAGSMSGSTQSQNVGNFIAVDPAGNIYTTGYYDDTTDFDPGPGILNLAGNIAGSAFIHKMNQAGLSISEIAYKQPPLIYPNPSNGLYAIELPAKAEITITNVLGETVLTQSLQPEKSSIDLQQQPRGIYFVKVVSEGKTQMSKLVKN
jgi:hypothetical protein